VTPRGCVAVYAANFPAPRHEGWPVGCWDPKLRRNVERDRAADMALAAAGWAVVRVWEHEPLEAATVAVIAALAISRP
jgi:G:T-mismatch repair DNA endonuclease (very short patch repair protein)